MLDKILVPLDGSELAERIFSQIRPVLVRSDAHVVLTRVVTESEAEKKSDAARSYLERTAQRLRDEGAQVSDRLREGDPAAEILALARELHPDLIAMATHGRTGIARWTRGSVAERVLRASPAPLLLANPFALSKEQPAAFRRILVPIDGSEIAAEIIPLAVRLAELYKGEIFLVHAFEFIEGEYPRPYALREAEKRAEAILAEAAERISTVPLHVRHDPLSAADAILRTVEKEKIDLVAMTTHGRGGLSRWIFGSVAEHVARHCPVPLLVKRTLAREISHRDPVRALSSSEE